MHDIPGFQIDTTIHSGRKSTIVGAMRLQDGARVVLKFAGPDAPRQDIAARLHNEYHIMAALDIAGVTRVLDCLDTVLGVVLVFEPFVGKPLSKHDFNNNLEAMLTTATDLVDILDQIQRRKIIHMDINPRNILLGEEGEVRIIDFGISRAPFLKGELNKVLLEGTLPYISPEQTGRIDREVDYRTDFYSLGVTLYELFTGRKPFVSTDSMELVHAHIARSPEPPHLVNPRIPEALSAIILKLMEKDPEGRYQSGYGLKMDLETCLRNLVEKGGIESFPLGMEDSRRQFRMPNKVYGRHEELAQLKHAFLQSVGGDNRLVLVGGGIGSGRTTLVDNLRLLVANRGGFFISTSSERRAESNPYDSLLHVLRKLIGVILANEEEDIALYRAKILDALDRGGSVITDVLPDLIHVIGEQPEAPDLPPIESGNRFKHLFLSLVRSLAAKDHPLVLFFDDVQWADAESRNLLALMFEDRSIRYLTLIASYSTEDDQDPPPELMTDGHAHLLKLELQPFTLGQINGLLADTFGAAEVETRPLAQQAFEKTGGNPFFLNQFLETLQSEDLIVYHFEDARWHWDLDRIRKQDFSENVVAFMTEKTAQLSPAARELLFIAACIGMEFDFRVLTEIWGRTEAETALTLWEIVGKGALIPVGLDDLLYYRSWEDAGEGASDNLVYRFLHDRVQKAALGMAGVGDRGEIHLRMGRLLLDKRPEQEGDEVFEIVRHFNRADLPPDADERMRVALLNLEAGDRAETSAAFLTASKYYASGISCLPENAWESNYRACFDLHYKCAVARYLCGNFDGAGKLFDVTLARAADNLEKADVLCRQSQLYSNISRFRDSINACSQGLALFGIQMPQRMSQAKSGYKQLYVQIRNLAGDGDIAAVLPALPDMTSPEHKACAELLAALFVPAANVNHYLMNWATNKLVLLSMEHGMSRESAFAFCSFGLLVAGECGDFDEGHRISVAAASQCDRFDDDGASAKVMFYASAYISPWREPFRVSTPVLRESFRRAVDVGRFVWAGYAAVNLILRQLNSGASLEDVERECGELNALMDRTRDRHVLTGLQLLHQVIGCLRGETASPISLNSKHFDETAFEEEVRAANYLQAHTTYLICKQQILYMNGHLREAAAIRRRLKRYLPVLKQQIWPHLVEYYLFDGLAVAGLYPDAPWAEQKDLKRRLSRSIKLLKLVSERSPANFRHKLLLLEAVEQSLGDDFEATMSCFDAAVEDARDHGFSQFEALSNELAFNYLWSRGHEQASRIYLLDACEAYRKWGALTRFRMIKNQVLAHFPKAYRYLSTFTDSYEEITTYTSGSLELDLSTVIKAGQAISEEIVLEKLLGTLMRIVLESAGAQHGYLILNRDGQLTLEAEGTADGDQVRVGPSAPISESADFPTAIIQYVFRSGANVVLHDAQHEGLFTGAGYIVKHQPLSLLCVQVRHHGRAVGILYLENNLTTGAFTAQRLKVLNLLLSQIAISIENAVLYANLTRAQEELRDHNYLLERKVAERTSELADKNTELEATLNHLTATQKQLIHSEKMASLGQLTAGIAHEIKNPLNFVNNFAELSHELIEEVREELSGDCESDRPHLLDLVTNLDRNLDRIHSHGRKADSIVQSMLMHSRGNKGSKEPTDLNQQLAGDVSLAYHSMRAKNKAFNVDMVEDYDQSIGQLMLVKQDISRVFLNLIHNACYAVAKRFQEGEPSYKPTIRLETRDHGGHIEVIISDNGGGISPADRQKVFSPFFTTKPTGEGTGLGLSISHDIVVQGHQGSLELSSDEGQGAVFTITLPRSDNG